jgi:polyhydroxyalkanoate synthesis regulator phasin
MNHIYEQILYTTIGTLKISKNKFLELMEDLIQNQPYAEDEGKRIFLEYSHKIDTFKKDLQSKFILQLEETRADIEGPIHQKVDKVLKEFKQKIQDYSIQQLMSKKN